MPQAEQKVRFGLNYVPSRNWWYSWVDWSEGSVREDLEAIAALGMDHIRIHCLWPLFQPNAAYVSEAMLQRLEGLMELAAAAGLDVAVTVLDGWLSGFAFEPAWLKGRNMFTEPGVVEAEKLLFRELAARIGQHPRFLGFDIGNELSCMTHYGHGVTLAHGDAWQCDMLDLCEQVAPGGFHVSGVDHQQWFGDRTFSREALARTGAATSLHTWLEFTGARCLYGHTGVGAVHLAEYCVELAKAYSLEPGRPVWLQEFGASSQWMPPGDIPDFAEATIRSALTCSDVWGVTWWCSHDLSRELAEFDPLEYDLGLLDVHNKPKPVGRRVAELIREVRATPTSPLERTVAVVMPDDLFADGKAHSPEPGPGALLPSPGWRLGKPYMELVAQGMRPAIVLQSRASDQAYLRRRGISELLTLPC